MAKSFWEYPLDPLRVEWPDGVFIGFDPSIAHTGWAVVVFAPFSNPVVAARGRFETSPYEDEKGQRETLLRGQEIFLASHRLVEALVDDRTPVGVGIEIPLMTSKMKFRPEQGYVASTALLSSLSASGLHAPSVTMVTPDALKKRVTGYGGASKQEVKSEVLRILGVDLVMNTDVSDAIGAALCAAMELVEDAGHEPR